MANLLDEMNDPVLEEGRDTGVIAKRIPVKVGFGSTLFEIMLWGAGHHPRYHLPCDEDKGEKLLLRIGTKNATQRFSN